MSAPLPGSAPSPTDSARERRRHGRRFIRVSQRAIRSDAILITVIAVSMTLSAFSVYQATRASDEAGNLLDQARIVHTEQSRQAGFLQTLVDHDVDVLRPMCRATVERDVARVSLLDNSFLDDSSRLGELVAANVTLDSLQPLLLGDRTATCSPADSSSESYVIQRAQDRLIANGTIPGLPDASRLETRAAAYSLNERFLMAAGFLFATVVAAIIVIDQLGERLHRPGGLRSRTAHRWQYASATVASVALVTGVVLLVANAVDWIFSVALGASLVILLVGQCLWVRRVRIRPPQTVDRIRAHWWAEVVGAFALVAFTAAAVGLSLASIQERDANARANRQDVVAMDLQRLGQLQALRDLSAVSFVASLEAQDITLRQLAARGSPVDDPERLVAMRNVSDDRMRDTDQGLRDQTSATLADETSGICAPPPATDARAPEDLFKDFGQNPDAVMGHVLSQQLPAKSCDVVAALSRHEARLWSDHASTLTVALVVLGLAGFLLALAASSERSARSSRMLLLIGAAGTTLGLVLALVPAPAFLFGARVPNNANAQEFGTTIAGALQNPCEADPEHLDQAIATFDEYGPAFLARAYHANCVGAVHSGPAFSADVDPAALPGILDDLSRALKRGPVTPQLVGELGWFEILYGIQNDDDQQLWRGLKSTGSALAQIEASSLPTGQGVHILRFNRALAIAALGDSTVALREYQKAERCLELEEGCLGGGIEDDDIVVGLRLAALADLELIRDRPGVVPSDVDDYRFAVLDLENADSSMSIPRAQLDLYPQELQLTVVGGGWQPSVSVVWYYRADSSTSWAVLPAPSASTMRVGRYLDTPISARGLLEAGEYRADVYLGGQRAEWHGEYPADHDLAHRESERLGVSIVVPRDWREWRNDGVEWHFGPDEATGITLRRVEGMVPDEIQPYLEGKLRDWSATASDSGLTAYPEWYFLGLSKEHFVINGSENVIEAAGLASYATSPGCGGTLFMARVTANATSPSAFDLFNSIVLEREPDRLPAITGPIEAGGMSVSIPSHWDGAARPEGGKGDLISAKDCDSFDNLLVSEDIYESDVESQVKDSLRDYSAVFPAFDLESEAPLDVPGATEAKVIRYTWLPEGHSEPVRQWQIFTRRGDNQGLATITTRASDLDFYDSDLIIGSIAMSDRR